MADASNSNGLKTAQKSQSGIVDCDIHPHMGMDKMSPFLSERWKRQLEAGGMSRWANESLYYPRPRRGAYRADTYPPNGGLPGSDPDYMREQLLDAWDIEIGILNPSMQMMFANQPPELAAEVTRATNESMLVDFMDGEPRLRGSICISWEDADLGVREIERLSGDRRLVQVLGNNRNQAPLGNRKYWKIYETAEGLDLPVAFHVGGGGGHTLTGAGWPSYYFEDHSGYGQAFHSQMISLIYEGVFDKFPSLKVVFQEGGFSWVSTLAWRMDHAWSMLRDEVPSLQRKPSEYVHDHFWYTTQPIEEHLVQSYEQFGLQDRLLFSTDYPHWDFDAPDVVLPATVPPEVRKEIMGGNAKALYKLQ
jgi:uncharacterized protein